jgi:fumarate reductase flavoprotein subunit
VQADFIVIGAGGAGLAAAVTAAEGGANVVILERSHVAGGATVFATGTFAVESKFQKALGIRITTDDAFRQHMFYTHYLSNPRLVRTIIDRSAETIDWLEQRGTEFIEPAEFFPGAPPTWHTMKHDGRGITKALEETARDLKVLIRFRTRAKELIMEDGRVAGVRAEDQDGKIVECCGKAVLIADGGFANNQEMMKRYTQAGDHTIEMVVGQIGKEGDGIRMAWEAGAGEEGANLIQLGPPRVVTKKLDKHITAILRQPFLWVNANGDRFLDESELSFPHIGNAMSKQPGQVLFNLFDHVSRKRMEEEGIKAGLGMFSDKGARIPDVLAAIQTSMDDDEAWVAESIEEFAEKMGMDSRRLRATIDDYNAFCDAGRDGLFAKDPEYLEPVRTPPFYAVKGHPTHVGTLGGIKINHETEVIREDSLTGLDVIPGLYAAGNVAGGMYGDTYDASHTIGLTSAFAVISGRIAGASVLEYIGKKGDRDDESRDLS